MRTTVASASPFSPGFRRADARTFTRKGSGVVHGAAAGGGGECEHASRNSADSAASPAHRNANPANPKRLAPIPARRSLPAKCQGAQEFIECGTLKGSRAPRDGAPTAKPSAPHARHSTIGALLGSRPGSPLLALPAGLGGGGLLSPSAGPGFPVPWWWWPWPDLSSLAAVPPAIGRASGDGSRGRAGSTAAGGGDG